MMILSLMSSMVIMLNNYIHITDKEILLTNNRMDLIHEYLSMIENVDDSDEIYEFYTFEIKDDVYYFYFDERNQIKNTKKEEK